MRVKSRVESSGTTDDGVGGTGGTDGGAVRACGRVGTAWRLAVTGGVLVLVATGTVWGQDSAFPFGPFRMYSTRNDPNAPVVTTQIEAVTVDGGRRITISGTETGLRRAEVEGQLKRFVQEPELLATVAAAYERRHPGDRLARVEVVRRDHPLRAGRATGEERATVLTTWTVR